MNAPAQPRLQKDPAYRQVFKASTSLFLLNHTSCWLARDHLLVVEVTGFTESYTRFHLDQIQAFLVVPTRHGRLLVALFSVLTFLTLAPAAGLALYQTLSGSPTSILKFVFAIPGALMALCLVWALFNRASCDFHIQTAVQTRRIPGLRTRRQVHRFLSRLAAARETVPAPPSNPDATPPVAPLASPP